MAVRIQDKAGVEYNKFVGEWRALLAKLVKTDPEKAKALKGVRIRKVYEAGTALAVRAKEAVKGGTFAGGPGSGAYSGPVEPGKELLAPSKGGPLAKVGAQVPPQGAAKGATKAAAKAGGSMLGKAARLATGPVGGTLLGLMMPLGSRGILSLPGAEGRARDKAVEGFAALGATSSPEFLGELSRQQELAARRKTVLQTFEPEMFQQILMALADTGQKPNNLTATEQRIGASYEEQVPARRPDKDVEFLLDQLMTEMSGAL